MLAALAVLALVSARTTFDPVEDRQGNEVACPSGKAYSQAHFQQLGNRLMYERRHLESQACLQRAMELLWGDEEVVTEYNGGGASSFFETEARFQELFPGSHHMEDEVFSDVHKVAEMMQEQVRAAVSFDELRAMEQAAPARKSPVEIREMLRKASLDALRN